MEQYRDRPAHLEKIAYQQRLLQEDVVHIRAQISRVSTVRLSNTCECVCVCGTLRGGWWEEL